MRGEADAAGAPRRTLVAVLVSDTALEERLAAAVADAPGLMVLSADAAEEADVIVSDGTITASRPTVLLADSFAPEAAGEARAVLPTTVDAALLRAAIDVVAAGYALVASRDSFEEESEPDHPSRAAGARTSAAVPLTPRESEVLNLIAQGASNKLVARRLGISVHTAKYHVASLLLKLGAQNRSDAVAIGMREGLVFM
jgi:DNA-binding CsgD family transcriptional regulator